MAQAWPLATTMAHAQPIKDFNEITYPVKVGVFGHSFVRRLADRVSLDPTLDEHFSLEQANVHWVYRGGQTFTSFSSDVIDGLPEAIRRGCVIAILDLATNDLDSDLPVLSIVDQAWETARKLLKSGVHRLVMLKVLYRHKARQGGIPLEEFNQRVDTYNDTMKGILMDLSSHKNNPRRNKYYDLWWWDTKKLQNPDLFLDDGIHLDGQGLKIYYEQIKLAVIMASRDFY